MRLSFAAPELEYSARMIADFLRLGREQSGEIYAGMGETILRLYPEFDKNELGTLKPEETPKYLEEKLRSKYEEIKPEALEKLGLYQKTWNAAERNVERTLGEIFGVDTTDNFNDMLARITMNPVCPRFLEDRSFDIFYLYSDKGAMYIALHEITHFVWFELWHKLFGDARELYEQPHLPWIISELAIDAVLTDDRLNGFIANESVARQPAYQEFYEIETAEGRLIDIMRELYKNNSTESFMRSALEFCERNKTVFGKVFSA